MFINRSDFSKMKAILVIWCLFAVSTALYLAVPIEGYPTKFVYDDELLPVNFVGFDEEEPLSKRVGRQGFGGIIPLGNEGLPVQSRLYCICYHNFTNIIFNSIRWICCEWIQQLSIL